VLANRHENFASQMPTLFATVELILEVDCGGAVLGEELRKLDDCG